MGLRSLPHTEVMESVSRSWLDSKVHIPPSVVARFLLSRKENTEVKFSTLSAGIFLNPFSQYLSQVILTPQWWAAASTP